MDAILYQTGGIHFICPISFVFISITHKNNPPYWTFTLSSKEGIYHITIWHDLFLIIGIIHIIPDILC